MKEMGFITLNGYNKVGDNSAINLLPLIADRMELGMICFFARESYFLFSY